MKLSELVGENIRALRLVVGLNQGELAEAMEHLGFRWLRQTVAETEAGRRETAIEELVALAAIFDMPLTAIVMAPGGLVPHELEIGDRVVPFSEWAERLSAVLAPRKIATPPEPSLRRILDRVTAGLDRPWVRRWRRAGGHPASPFWEARNQRLDARTRRLPGPTFLWEGEGPFVTSITVPPWGQSMEIAFTPGVPHVARDEYEAERLLEATTTHPQLRVISRQEAYRLRKKKGK